MIAWTVWTWPTKADWLADHPPVCEVTRRTVQQARSDLRQLLKSGGAGWGEVWREDGDLATHVWTNGVEPDGQAYMKVEREGESLPAKGYTP